MKKLKNILISLVLSVVFLTGCGDDYQKGKDVDQSDISSYNLEGDIQFVPVSYEKIHDGTINGLEMIKYVDLSEGTVYLYTEKYSSGFGTTWTLLEDKDGNPVLYEDLENLRDKYNWKE
jgi:hypothetical protein